MRLLLVLLIGRHLVKNKSISILYYVQVSIDNDDTELRKPENGQNDIHIDLQLEG